MKIEMPENGKIRIMLDEEDLNSYDISFEDMDYNNIETRRVIWTLLDEARRELETDIDPSGRMLIEVMPGEKGGCVMYFTVLSPEQSAVPKRLLMKKNLKPIVFEFENIDSLLGAIDCINNQLHSSPKGELYSYNGKYRLILSSSSYFLSLPKLLSEYGKYIGEGNISASITREHWKMVSSKNIFNK